MAFNPAEDPGYQSLVSSTQAEEALLRAEIERKRGAVASRYLRQSAALTDTASRGLEAVAYGNEARGMLRSGRHLRDVGRHQTDVARKGTELQATNTEAQADLAGVLERAIIQNKRRLSEAEIRARERLALEQAEAGLAKDLLG